MSAARSALVVAFAVVAVGCSHRSGPKAPAEKPAVPVKVATVDVKPEPLDLPAIGRVVPLETVGVKPLVGGEIVAIHFVEGDEVKKGAPLFTIDPRPYEAALSQAKANLAKDEAQRRQAASDARRFAALIAKGYVSRQQAAQAKSNAAALAAAVAADRAAERTAELDLAYTEIHAPISGKTGELQVRLGNVVKANPDTPLVTINQLQPIGVDFTLPSSELPVLQEHLEDGPLAARATPPGGSAGPMGALTFINNAVDPTTGTIALRATFLNEDERLWPGEPVDVVLTVAVDEHAIVVPSAAVQQGQQGTFAFVVKPDRSVQSRPVKVERTVGDETIVAGGLEPGDEVVTDGALALVSGAKVQIVASTPPRGAPPGPPRGREKPR